MWKRLICAAAGAAVLRQPVNRGKGAALKAGFAWARRNAPGEAVVCADCDGQHTPDDVARVLAQQGVWSRVRLDGGREGWMERDGLVPLAGPPAGAAPPR